MEMFKQYFKAMLEDIQKSAKDLDEKIELLEEVYLDSCKTLNDIYERFEELRDQKISINKRSISKIIVYNFPFNKDLEEKIIDFKIVDDWTPKYLEVEFNLEARQELHVAEVETRKENCIDTHKYFKYDLDNIRKPAKIQKLVTNIEITGLIIESLNEYTKKQLEELNNLAGTVI